MAYYYSDSTRVPNFNVPFVGTQGVADFNGDGIKDFVIAPINFGKSTQNEIKILASDGTGGFFDATRLIINGSVPNLFQARQLVISDFNGDGRPDIFIANQGLDLSSTSSPGERNTLLLSQSDGRLVDVSATHIPQVSDFSHSVSVADINRDGAPDLFIGNFSGTGQFKQSYFLINDGRGNFTIDMSRVPQDIQPGQNGIVVGTSAIADFNGDGNLDLFVGAHNVPGKASGIYYGNASGSFAGAPFSPIPSAILGGQPADAVRTVVADFNGDGRLDLAVSYYGSPARAGDVVNYQGREVQLLLNDGSGHFTDVTATNLPLSIVDDGQTSQWVQELVAKDVNNDGKVDLVITALNSSGVPPKIGSPVMWLNNGNAQFTVVTSTDIPNKFGWNGYPSPFGIVDSTDTGHNDLLSVGYRPELLRQSANLPATSSVALFGEVNYAGRSAGGQVYALYEGLLGRAPDPLGLEVWTASLKAGFSSRGLAASLLASPEGQSRAGALDNGSFVEQLYGTTLHRQSDAAGLNYYVNQLNQGATRADVAMSFAFSNEHLATLRPALDAGVYVPDASAANVSRLYYAVLDRAPDAAGLNYWTTQVKQGVNINAVTQSFLSAPEVQAKTGSLSSAQYVDTIYLNALGRHAEASGLGYWSSQLDQGASRVGVTTAIGLSGEAQLHHLAQIELGLVLA